MSNAKKTVFIMVPPEFGHVNPISCVSAELVKQNVRVIFYGNEEQRDLVDRTRAEFRLYTHRNFAEFEKIEQHEETRDLNYEWFSDLMKYSYIMIPDFLRDVETDQPDLIVYDPLFMPGKYLVKILEGRNGLPKKPMAIEFMPNLVFNEQIIGELPEVDPETFWTKMNNYLLYLKQFIFNVYYRVWIWHPIQLWLEPNPNLTIVGVNSQLQLKRETFNDTYKFVGSCISEKVRNYEVTDEKLKQILDMFKPRERFDSKIEPNDSLKLIYVSLGTTFSHNSRVYEKIIDGLKLLNDDRIKLDKLQVVISLGPISFEKIGKKINEGSFQLPDNCFIFVKVPQIELLKRASLFISHCGQNSTNESIQYGVPVIGVPIIWDQPLMAQILAEKYKAGIYIKTNTFQPKDLSNAIVDILTDSKYKQNMLELSKSFQTTDGSKMAADIIIDYMNQHDEQNKKNN